MRPLFAGTVQTHWGGYDPKPPTGPEAHEALQKCLAEAELAERSGFDGVLVAERHARSECVGPDPVGLLGAIAARTERIFLGSYVQLLSLHHPIDVAESWAQLDCLSGGRAVAGVGIGYNDRYFDLFGVPRKERRRRFDRALEIIRAAWAGEELETEWEGRPVRGEVHPRPHGRIPIWMGSQFPKTIAHAGAVADGWAIAFPFDRARWDEMRAIYEASARENGRARVIALSRHCWVADSREEAVSFYAPLWLEELSYYWHRGQVTHADFTSEADLTPENAAKNLILGTPEQCAEQIVELVRDWGVDVLKIAYRTPLGPSAEEVAQNIERIGTEVLPLVRRELGLPAEPTPAPAQVLRDEVAAAESTRSAA
jgi:alkanesulfonate monooxygenase SsuD/methylene tetrahydromethanopterin reductase-like flavin-dependent oxidoreductase (luciferase family)